MNIFREAAVRKIILAATTILAIAAPSIADAQQRPQGQPSPRPTQQDARKWGDFQGALRDIAGSRLNRAHAERRNKPEEKDKNKKGR